MALLLLLGVSVLAHVAAVNPGRSGGVVVNESVVFRRGEGGYACFRVPSIATVGDTLLVFAEARRTSCADQAPKDIVYKRSSDGGATWGDLTRLVGTDTGNTTYRNPYATVCHKGSDASCPAKLLVGFVNSTLQEPWVNLRRWSCDAGKTWSGIERIDLAPWEGVLAGPGTGIQLTGAPHAQRVLQRRTPPGFARGGGGGSETPVLGHVGRRIVGCGATGYHKGHSMNAVVWFSDDGGATYNVSASSFAEMQECQVVQLWNGTLVLNMRNSHLNPCKCRAYALSHDGGATWEGPYWAPALIEPVCSAGLVRVGSALYFSNPHSTSQRANMTVQVATTNAMDWRVYQQLWAGPAAYSVMGSTPSALPCIVYERGTSSPYEELAFAALEPA